MPYFSEADAAKSLSFGEPLKEAIYLDYAATTPVAPSVISAMSRAMEQLWGNVSSPHLFGALAEQAVESSLDEIAHFLGCERDELIVTSGATESINQALKGVMRRSKKRHLITSTVEHKATLQVAQQLIKEGVKVTFLTPNSEGVISPKMVEEAITDESALISLIWVNNETGTIFDLPEIAKMARRRNVLLHVDATQATPHFPLDLKQFDLASLSGHKCYGPKGIGLLYRRNFPRLPLQPLIDGSGGQLGIRSGTMMNEQIIGLAEAFRSLKEGRAEAELRYRTWGDYLLAELAPLGVSRNGASPQIASLINLHIPDVHHDLLMASLPDLALSKGSACNSDDQLPSYVLTESGYSHQHATQSIRISLGEMLTFDTFKSAVERLKGAIEHWQSVARHPLPMPALELHEPHFSLKITFTPQFDFAYRGGPYLLALLKALKGESDRVILAQERGEFSFESILGIKIAPNQLQNLLKVERAINHQKSSL